MTVGRDFLTNAEDLISLADTVNIDKFFLVGVSGGSPHAFTIAAKYPERIRGILSLSGACDLGTAQIHEQLPCRCLQVLCNVTDGSVSQVAVPLPCAVTEGILNV